MALNHTIGFRNAAAKHNHYQKHIIEKGEFVCADADEYEERADTFLGKPAGGTIREYVRKNADQFGDVIKWDTATNEYGVVDSSGTILTYFIVDYAYGTNEQYFELEIAKDEAKL